MTIMKKIILLIINYIFISSTYALDNEEIHLTTLHWPPYVDSNEIDHGYIAHIIKMAFAYERVDVKIHYRPWTRGVKETTRGNFDGIFPTYKSKKRLKQFIYSDIIDYSVIGHVARIEDELKIQKSKDDLSKFRFGLVSGYSNTRKIDNNVNLQKDFALSDENNIDKLCKGRVDIIVIDLNVFKKIYNQDKFKNCPQLKPILRPLENKALYLSFNKNDKNSKELRDKFNKGLNQVKKNLDKIKKKYLLD